MLLHPIVGKALFNTHIGLSNLTLVKEGSDGVKTFIIPSREDFPPRPKP